MTLFPLTAALHLLAGAASGAARNPIKPLKPIVDAWSGQFNCKTGNYDANVAIEEAGGGLFVRYAATTNGVAVKITLAEKGQVLVIAPAARADGEPAAIRFAGAARLDKKRTKAIVRFTVTNPFRPDSCMDSMAEALAVAP